MIQKYKDILNDSSMAPLNFLTTVAALHGCELRNRDLSAKIIFIAKRKHDFTINLAIMQNGC